MELKMIPKDCPRFDKCSAAVCPLDPNWFKTHHRQGERICYYLINSEKEGAEERFKNDVIFQECQKMKGKVRYRFKAISIGIEKSALTPFKGQHLMKEES